MKDQRLKNGVRRIYLPNGASFDLPLSDNSSTLLKNESGQIRGADGGSVVVPLAIGLVVGGVAGWLAYKLSH